MSGENTNVMGVSAVTIPTVTQAATRASIFITSDGNIVLDLSGNCMAYTLTLTPDAALDLSRHLRRAVMVVQSGDRQS